MSKVSSKQMMNMAAIFAVLIAVIIFMRGREETTEHARGRPSRNDPRYGRQTGKYNVRNSKAARDKAMEAARRAGKSYSRTAKRLGFR